jgi:hypothetical protein
MKISILETEDIEKIPKHLDISYLIIKKSHEIIIIPCKGIPYQIAKLYKKSMFLFLLKPGIMREVSAFYIEIKYNNSKTKIL